MERQEQTLKTRLEIFENWIRMAELDVLLSGKIYDAALPEPKEIVAQFTVTV